MVNVELQSNRLNIRRSLSWARVQEESEDKTPERAEPRFFEPKTASSRRTIPLSPELVAALRRWKLQCPKGKDDLVFPSPTSETGAPAHRSNVLKRGLYPALTRAKLRRVDMHSLRHSFASILIAARRSDHGGSGAAGQFGADYAQGLQSLVPQLEHEFDRHSFEGVAWRRQRRYWPLGGHFERTAERYGRER